MLYSILNVQLKSLYHQNQNLDSEGTDATTSFSGSGDDLDRDGSVEEVEDQNTIVEQDMTVGVG